jgi:DNA-binding MarR family transcriptional regulator
MSLDDKIKSSITLNPAKRTVLNMVYTNQFVNDKFIEVLKPFDLSIEQFNVLRILRGQKGVAANMCLIQERMLARTSNTTRLVDKLLLKGLVTREVCPGNRRKMEVMITEQGLKLLSEVDPKVDQYEEMITSGLTPGELEELNRLLEKFRNNY